jgi:Ankyrin repeats (3 copies)
MMEVLSEKSDLMFTNTQGIGPLYFAIKGNKVDSIRFLLGKHIPIYYERTEKMDNSPIFYAIRCGNLSALELFCD